MTTADDTACRLRTFYDGSCPLCRAEIAYYRRQPGAEAVEWIDVSLAQVEVAPGLTREVAMRRFHVQQADGTLVSGSRAFAALWAVFPRLRWLAAMTRLPLVITVLEVAYRLFLPLRPWLQRLAHRPTST